jgi:hypothetical protein
MTQPPDGDRQHPDPADQTPAAPADQPTSSRQAPAADQPTGPWFAPSPEPGGAHQPPPDQPTAAYAPPDQPPGAWAAPAPDQPTAAYPPPDHPLGPPPGGAGAPSGGGSRRALMIVGVVLVAVLVLSGASVGTWLLLSDSDRGGATAPVEAVDSFLRAVYRDQDADAASALVCSEARDEEALAAKVASIQAHQEAYHRALFSWDDPKIVEETGQLAVVAVTVTMITGNEETADQDLRVSVLDKDPHGWWVCDVDSVGDDTEDAEEPDDAENGDEDENGDASDADEDGDEDE